MANTRTNGPHLSFRKDGEVGGYWTTTLPGGGGGWLHQPFLSFSSAILAAQQRRGALAQTPKFKSLANSEGRL